MKPIFSMTIKGPKSLAIYNANTGQVVKIVTVDGDIIGTPNVSGDTGTVVVRKNNMQKTYVYDLKNGSVKKIFNV